MFIDLVQLSIFHTHGATSIYRPHNKNSL